MDDINDRGITDELVDEIVDTVKIVTNIDNDEILEIYTRAICLNLLLKTNRRIFVPELKYVVIDMVTDKYTNNNITDNDIQSIQSMSEDNRSVNFGVSDTTKAKLNILAQKLIQDNENIVNKFKLLYKT